MSEKGSIKDRLKAWWIVLLERKRKKKEREKKEKERMIAWQKKHGVRIYSKPEVFVLTCVGLLTGLFGGSRIKDKVEYKNPKKTIFTCKQDKKELENILSNIKKIEKDINQTRFLKQTDTYNQTIQEQRKKIKQIQKKYEDFTSEKKALPSVVVAVTDVISFSNQVEKENGKIEQEIRQIQKKLQKQKENTILKKSVLVKEKESKQIFVRQPVKPKTKAELTVQIFAKDLEKDPLVETITKSPFSKKVTGVTLPKKENPKVKQILENHKFETLKEKIKQTEDPILLKQYIEKVKVMNQKGYSSFRCELLEGVALSKIEELDTKSKFCKRTEDDLAEIVLMEALILNNIKKQKKELKKFRKKIASLQVSQKSKGFMGGLQFFMNRTIKVVFSLFPLAMFKNKKIGLLTSAVLVNNNIRNMRNAIGKVNLPYIEYQNIASTIRKSEKETEHTKLVCEDSLRQVSELKKEFLEAMGYQNSPEIESLLKEMNQLEKMIESRTQELQKVSEDLKVAKTQNKHKIKKLEGIYGKQQ